MSTVRESDYAVIVHESHRLRAELQQSCWGEHIRSQTVTKQMGSLSVRLPGGRLNRGKEAHMVHHFKSLTLFPSLHDNYTFLCFDGLCWRSSFYCEAFQLEFYYSEISHSLITLGNPIVIVQKDTLNYLSLEGQITLCFCKFGNINKPTCQWYRIVCSVKKKNCMCCFGIVENNIMQFIILFFFYC